MKSLQNQIQSDFCTLHYSAQHFEISFYHKICFLTNNSVIAYLTNCRPTLRPNQCNFQTSNASFCEFGIHTNLDLYLVTLPREVHEFGEFKITMRNMLCDLRIELNNVFI